MFKKELKRIVKETKPCVLKLASDTLSGYVCGYALGSIIPSNEPLLKTMNRNGKRFAFAAAAYSAGELFMDRTFPRSPALSGAVAGALAGATAAPKSKIAASAILGFYSFSFGYFSKNA